MFYVMILEYKVQFQKLEVQVGIAFVVIDYQRI